MAGNSQVACIACVSMLIRWTASYHMILCVLQVGDDTGSSTRELTGHTDTVSPEPVMLLRHTERF